MGINPSLEQIEALDSFVLGQMWGIKPKILHDIQAETSPREQTKSKKLFSEAALIRVLKMCTAESTNRCNGLPVI